MGLESSSKEWWGFQQGTGPMDHVCPPKQSKNSNVDVEPSPSDKINSSKATVSSSGKSDDQVDDAGEVDGEDEDDGPRCKEIKESDEEDEDEEVADSEDAEPDC